MIEQQINLQQRRDLETRIAQALGWSGITDRFEQVGGSRVGKSPDNLRVLQPIPQYLIDYNAWSRVESYMAETFSLEQMGTYVQSIEQAISNPGQRRAETQFRMLNAPLPIRGLAFLAAVTSPLPEAA